MRTNTKLILFWANSAIGYWRNSCTIFPDIRVVVKLNLAESRSAEGGSPLPEREVSSHKPLFSFSCAAAGGKHGELESPFLQGLIPILIIYGYTWRVTHLEVSGYAFVPHYQILSILSSSLVWSDCDFKEDL
jgi:hypothetical protein